jgi:glycosyltransferase involved in cell wall biosynthesis
MANEAMSAQPAARVSLVVPLQDEEATVASLLLSIASQTRPPEEAIFVDAGSTDRTAALVTGFAAPFPLRVLTIGRVFPGVARNAGVAQASQQWIAFTDGGIRLDARWLEGLAAVTATDVDAVFGSIEPVCDTFFKTCAAVAYVPGRDQHGTRGMSIASVAIRRSVFEAIGGFAPFRASEDLIFIEKLTRQYRVGHAPDARVHWEIAGGWSSTYRRFAEYSWHNLEARRGRFWHLGVARLYVGLFLAVGLAALTGLRPWAPFLIPAFFLARALKAAWQKRGSFPFETLHPGRVACAAGVLAAIDAATLEGSTLWILGLPARPRRR